MTVQTAGLSADMMGVRGRRKRDAASGTSTRAAAWAILAVVILSPALGWGDSPQTAAHPPSQVVLFVATPDGQRDDPALLAAVQHEAQLAVSWLEVQTGMAMRGQVARGRQVRLDSSASALAGSTVTAVQSIHAEVMSQTRDPGIFPLIIVPVATATPNSGPQTCARGWTAGLVVLLGNCPSRAPSLTAEWGSELSRTIAHELVHGLGGVQDCAPNATTSGHVHDDPADLMYEGPEARPEGRIILDVGRDDYWQHDNHGCLDIADSPLWLRDRSGPSPT
ncbi:MAG TPA: hypothetical protein VMM13_08240 [Euzebya sp.]|nr:hypothetical protein [Euzebya sp.]